MITQQHVEQSINDSILGKSNLTGRQLSVEGFSTATMRHLFNNLCNIEGTYLEAGLFCGGTFVSSFNDKLVSIGVEDYSQPFGVNEVKSKLERNIEENKHISKDAVVHFEDCFSIDKSKLPSNIDILFYDAQHDELSQSKALPHFFDNMNNVFLYIVDDYNWVDVFNGTNTGLCIMKDKLNVVKKWELCGKSRNDDPIFHNGIGLFLIEKI